MQSLVWASTVPLELVHASSTTPYLLSVPRLSYLPLLLPRLTSFFGVAITSFAYEGVALRNLPVGLLCDLYQPPRLPWRIELGEGPLFDMHDTWVNSVKEADFIRYGTAKGIMSMSKENTTALWDAVQDNDFTAFSKINSILLNPSMPLKSIPLRIYIPSPPATAPSSSQQGARPTPAPGGSFKIMQSLIPPYMATTTTTSSASPNPAGASAHSRRPAAASAPPTTLGAALNQMLPSLFPSRRDALLADPILHGAVVPMAAPLEEVMREAAYTDGWVHLCVWMVDV